MVREADLSPEEMEAQAAEYVTGVLDADGRRKFERLADSVSEARQARLDWENRLSGLNSDYAPLAPPASIKKRIDERLFASTALAQPAAKGGLWNSLGFWRGLGMVGSAAAVAFGVYSTRLNEGLTDTRSQLTAALEEKATTEETLKAYESELAQRGERLTGLESELADARQILLDTDGQLQAALTSLEEALEREQPVLVVSLESGETDYRFLAVHEEGSDKVRMTLVSGEIPAEQDYELWLVEPQKDTISLGVVSSGDTAVELTPEHVEILEAGGLLAISVEQKGGSPTGVAQGPVVAVGAPRKL